MELSDIIIACQTEVGAVPDGEPGPDTWSKIYARLLGRPAVLDEAYVLFADGHHTDKWPPPPDMPAFIHKATEGTYFRDPLGASRRAEFKGQGGKWGWYHFTSGENVTDQANFFLSYMEEVGYQADDLICLDFEDSSRSGERNMTASEAKYWISIVEGKLGCKVCVYGSDLLTGALRDDPTNFARQPLWPAWYDSSIPVLPGGRVWAIWQFTDHGGGLYPDMDRFHGTEGDLRAIWPHLPS